MVPVNELTLAKTQLKCPVSQNLSSAERRAIRELKTNHSIAIKKADKGSAVVIMNRGDYIKEDEKQLSDTQFYKKVNSDYTLRHNDMVPVKDEQMFKGKEIKSSVRDFLMQNRPRTSQFYLLPKLHKSLKIPHEDPLYRRVIVLLRKFPS